MPSNENFEAETFYPAPVLAHILQFKPYKETHVFTKAIQESGLWTPAVSNGADIDKPLILQIWCHHNVIENMKTSIH